MVVVLYSHPSSPSGGEGAFAFTRHAAISISHYKSPRAKNYKDDQTLRLSNAEKVLDSCIDEQPTKNEGDLSEVRSVPNRK